MICIEPDFPSLVGPTCPSWQGQWKGPPLSAIVTITSWMLDNRSISDRFCLRNGQRWKEAKKGG